MHTLSYFLKSKDFTKVKLKHNATNHFEVMATINGVMGKFILDTGASNSCVGLDRAPFFKMNVEDSEIIATGAGDTNITTHISTKNTLQIGKWQHLKMTFVLFNLSTINNGLVSQQATPVDGIIGADILKKTKAIIDYSQKNLFLKASTKRRIALK